MTLFFLSIFLTAPPLVYARGTYQEPADFISETFAEPIPKPSKLWINKDLKAEINKIMERDLGVLRLRYWGRDGRTAWILDEIGKEKPITTGIVVNEGKIERVKVLIFRESRGGEVRYPFFTDQFKGSGLERDYRLDQNIDGISGATLSVRALNKLARLAVLLHRHSLFGAEQQN